MTFIQTIFMQDEVPPHIICCVMDVLIRYFKKKVSSATTFLILSFLGLQISTMKVCIIIGDFTSCICIMEKYLHLYTLNINKF